LISETAPFLFARAGARGFKLNSEQNRLCNVLLGILKKQNKRIINVRIRKKILSHLQPVLLSKDSSTDRKGQVFTDSYWKILKLALPVGLEGVFQTSFSLIDQIVVGRLGADAVAGVGLSNSISFIVLLFYSAIGTGSGVLIAQAFGQKKMGEVSATAAVGHMAAGLLGACTAIPLILFPEVILRWIGAQGDVANQAAGYFQLFAASVPLAAISAVTTGTFRSLNDTRTPMIITIGAVAFNTLVGFFLVLGIGPFPKVGVLGAGAATLLAQTIRCLVLLTALYLKQNGVEWRWPWQCPEIRGIFGQLFQTTYPLALSEMLWGISAFLYTVVFTRLGTSALAASQIVMVIENLFIVAASGLAPAAVALIGQAIGAGSIRSAKMHARMVLQLAAFAGLLFAVVLVGASFLLPALYPQVGNDVLRLAFWGLLIAALVQPAKVLNSVLGNGILPSGKDTKFILATHLIASYLVGLPAAVLFGIFWGLSARGVFSSRAVEEIVQAIVFFLRFQSSVWYKKSLDSGD
jgi:putative MATE family efflux protein